MSSCFEVDIKKFEDKYSMLQNKVDDKNHEISKINKEMDQRMKLIENEIEKKYIELGQRLKSIQNELEKKHEIYKLQEEIKQHIKLMHELKNKGLYKINEEKEQCVKLIHNELEKDREIFNKIQDKKQCIKSSISEIADLITKIYE